MQHVLLASIPHSGTNKCLRIFERAGFAQMGVDEPSNAHPNEDRVRWCHLLAPDRRDKVMELAAMGLPLVVPIRHPWRNLASFKLRSWAPENILQGLEAWIDCLDRVFPKAMLLPVDADEMTRARHKKVIERELGVELRPDWDRLVNTKHPTTAYVQLEDVIPKDAEWRDLDSHHLIKEIYP